MTMTIREGRGDEWASASSSGTTIIGGRTRSRILYGNDRDKSKLKRPALGSFAMNVVLAN